MKIKLENVRLSYPSLFKKAKFNGEDTKYEATFVLPKDSPQYEVLQAEIDRLIKEAKIKVTPDKICLKDGDDSDSPVYKNTWTIKAANSMRPTVINKDKSPLTEEDQVIYAGCYVNAIIEFWIQNNAYGKRVNANLHGVQFYKDGEPLSAGSVADPDDFDDVDI